MPQNMSTSLRIHAPLRHTEPETDAFVLLEGPYLGILRVQREKKHSRRNFQCQQKSMVVEIVICSYLANGQPFELLGIPYLVGKIKFKLFFRVHWLSECWFPEEMQFP